MRSVLIRAALALGVVALGRAAGAVEPPALDAVRQAAILPDAGFVAHLDLRGIRSSEVFASLGLARNEMLSRLTSVTGLAESDLLDVLVSAESGGIEVEVDDKGRHLSSVPGIMAVSLARPVSATEVREALERAWEGRGLSASQVNGTEIVEVSAGGPESPAFYAAASPTGSVIFLSSDREGLQGALGRARTGEYVSLPPELEALESSLGAGPQVRLALLTPPALSERLSGPSEGQPPTMYDRILEPFRGLKGIALGVSLGTDARLELVGNLGDETAAQAAEELLRSFLVPNLLRSLSMRMAGEGLPSDAVAVTTAGSMARISVDLRPEDLERLLRSGSSDPAEGPAPKP